VRHPVALTVTLRSILLGFVLAYCICAGALDPSLDISQYAHTAWKAREGFAKSGINSIAQTPDGYLWLATEFGLLRFDGVRNIPWQPPAGQQLPSTRIPSLLCASDGTLWIGTRKGLASWKDGKLTVYPELADLSVFSLFEDHNGTVWVGAIGTPPPGRLCAISNGKVQCHGEDGSLGAGVSRIYEDGKGNLWLATFTGVWRWKPGPAQFYPHAEPPIAGWPGLAEDADGGLLVGMRNGLRKLRNDKLEPYLLPGAAPQFNAQKMLRDRDGGLWIATSDHGVLHLHQGRVDQFASTDGLSSDNVAYIFEDREHNIWMGTSGGLDCFREFAVTTFTMSQGLPDHIISLLVARQSGIWVTSSAGLYRWENGRAIPYDGREGKLNGLTPISIFQDHAGRIWVSTRREFGYVQTGRYFPVRGVPAGIVNSVAEDIDGSLWITNQSVGLIRLGKGNGVEEFPSDSLRHGNLAVTLAADPRRSGLWLGFFKGGVDHLADGAVRESYKAADGLGAGQVTGLEVDRDGTLWAATEGGLSRLRDGHFATLNSKNGLPCDGINWAIDDDDRSLWLYTPCGLLRVSRTEIEAWARAADKGEDAQHTIRFTLFDGSDGVRVRAAVAMDGQVAKTSDGKLLFLPVDGVSVIDPRHLPVNTLPPPVHIEQITANGKTYDPANGLQLPPHMRDLAIHYTALSFVAPEKIHFRYKLEGQDPDWREVVNDRQVQYSNLAPRHYIFRLMACNNSGVWNEAGAVLDFYVNPAYYQTTWFRLSCVTAFLAALWGLYQFRLQQLARRFNIRLEERVNERTRIARELHDTMLQTFQGMLLKFYGLSFMLEDRPEAQQMLESLLVQGRQAIDEGREAVQGLRSSTVIANDLARALTTLGDGLIHEQDSRKRAVFEVVVEGKSRDLHPILRDEVYKIAGEAVRNAFHHSGGSKIEVEIHYDDRQFRLRVRDNGTGLDPKVMEGGQREGHYGVPGMRERAKLAGGKLTIFSKLNSGTELELTIPASLAYKKSRTSRRSLFLRRSA
jgi:signal transduction histidine kinase/streptogramin lyase